MAGIQMPNGATLEIASAYGAAIPFTALTNANPAVATAAAHGLAEGDIIAVSSGWTRLDGRAVQVGEIASGTFALGGVKTTNVQQYPAGSGVGSVREVASFTEISQVTELNSSGGDQQFLTFGFLADDDDRQMPTTKNPVTLAITVADDPSKPYVAVCEAADDDKQERVLRLNLPGGSSIIYNGYVSITSTPTMSRNNLMTRVISIALTGRPTRYSAV
ncbi:phage tail protein [Pseudomonas sp. FW306-02-F02-AA]|uniref:Phage tail protein n=1 Tax=Pseudomonas fluorescens TaxID=294 RepID=A0A0N9VUP0_PSEFL|nr:MULTISPECIES: phage tail protein [Pseudomonas]ALI04384.1 phage tail protein [Pseudomonas fluorescens]PMZ03861.1 phage tail protein [Pseudomonas sp. FW306-02-F02-AB]PMZ08226.1 phage tail protein [Pseudomonas sp. FW306-02-H06C]PMZ13966.1 phage tail protein [Pseudomonas sp. FW306-02-F02-AA]PMZ21525.1 phage tail protein [Pseudomonas sp. FW306-02-F08-AA]